jgi:iron(II)-dependent oxidoreductase
MKLMGMLFASLLFLGIVQPSFSEDTIDAFIGLDNPSEEAWQKWYGELQLKRAQAREKIRYSSQIYDDPKMQWSDQSFRQFKVFIYDQRFFRDGQYQVQSLVKTINEAFGGADSVLLWHAYPRIGFDSRDQFAFYEDMPGGLSKLRDVVAEFHAAGMKVFVNYNPWDIGGDDNPNVDSEAYQNSYRRLGEIIRAINADGVMLDTLNSVPSSLRSILDQAKPGVVLAPERRATDSDLLWARQSWAQWYQIGKNQPSIYRHKWIEPRHQQLATRRWDDDRRADIVYSFFNGSGLLIWDNIYGSRNPYSKADRILIAQTGSILRKLGPVFTKGTWLPLRPSGVSGVDRNTFALPGLTVHTFRNRTSLEHSVPFPESTQPCVSFWDRRTIDTDRASTHFFKLSPHGTEAIVCQDDLASLRAMITEFDSATDHAEKASYDDARVVSPLLRRHNGNAGLPRGGLPARSAFSFISGGDFNLSIVHKRRECGCYDRGATPDNLWGWYYEDQVGHTTKESLAGYWMKKTAVTNAEYLEFVHATGYFPDDPERFLQHLPRDQSGALLKVLPQALAELPVTFVSIGDARAYADWRGEALPTEAQWQWAAQGRDRQLRFPWGNEAPGQDLSVFNHTQQLESASARPKGQTVDGLLQMSGNIWELTESEMSDGLNRFLVLRGGSYLSPASSVWIIPRGPRPNDFHAKYLLMSDGLDRSESVGFRTVINTKTVE